MIPITLMALNESFLAGKREADLKMGSFRRVEELLLPEIRPSKFVLMNSKVAKWLWDEAEFNFAGAMTGDVLDVRLTMTAPLRDLMRAKGIDTEQAEEKLRALGERITRELGRTNIRTAGPECWRHAMAYGDSLIIGRQSADYARQFMWEVVPISDVVLGKNFPMGWKNTGWDRQETPLGQSRTPIFICLPNMTKERVHQQYGNLRSFNNDKANELMSSAGQLPNSQMPSQMGGGACWLCWFGMFMHLPGSNMVRERFFMAVYREGERSSPIVGEEIVDPLVVVHSQYQQVFNQVYGVSLSPLIMPQARSLDYLRKETLKAIALQANPPVLLPSGSMSPQMRVAPKVFIEWDPRHSGGARPEAMMLNTNFAPLLQAQREDEAAIDEWGSRGPGPAQMPDRMTAAQSLDFRQAGNQILKGRAERIKQNLLKPLVAGYIRMLQGQGKVPTHVFEDTRLIGGGMGIPLDLEIADGFFEISARTNTDRAIDAAEVDRTLVLLQSVSAAVNSGAITPDQAAMFFDPHGLLMNIATRLNVDPSVFSNSEEWKLRMEDRAKMQMIQAQLAGMLPGAGGGGGPVQAPSLMQ